MPLSNRQAKFMTPISTGFSPFSLLCRTLQPTQVQNRVSLGLPPKTEHQNVSTQQFIHQILRFPDHKPTEGGLFGNISGYITGKGMSKGGGKGVKPVGEIAGLFAVSVGGIWGIVEDATLGIELAGVARSLKARTQGRSANQCQAGERMVRANLHCKSNLYKVLLNA